MNEVDEAKKGKGALQLMSKQSINSRFYDVSLGDQKYGILGIT